MVSSACAAVELAEIQLLHKSTFAELGIKLEQVRLEIEEQFTLAVQVDPTIALQRITIRLRSARLLWIGESADRDLHRGHRAVVQDSMPLRVAPCG